MVKLTAKQKDEIRRLTQLANRRIIAAEKAYRKEGKEVIPRDIAGPYQARQLWHTDKTPISRSVKFESEKEYREHLRLLRSFDPKATKAYKPGIKEYTQIQREKVGMAIKSTLGEEVTFAFIEQKLSKMTAPQVAEFWKRFSDKAARLGLNYSSDAVMSETFQELFPEDLYSTIA